MVGSGFVALKGSKSDIEMRAECARRDTTLFLYSGWASRRPAILRSDNGESGESAVGHGSNTGHISSIQDSDEA